MTMNKFVWINLRILYMNIRKLFHCFKKEKLMTTKETQTDWKVYEDNTNRNPLLSAQENVILQKLTKHYKN
jgi:hypothetical protein